MGSNNLMLGSDESQIGQYTISLLTTYRYLSEFHCMTSQTVVNLGRGKKINCFSGKTFSKLGSGGEAIFLSIN